MPTLELSYAFNADEKFYIGGTVEDYTAFVCEPDEDEDDDDCDAENPEPSFDNEGVTLENAIPTATAELNFAEPLYYSGMDLVLKINDYVPPMTGEDGEQVLALDTWYR